MLEFTAKQTDEPEIFRSKVKLHSHKKNAR